MNNEKVLKQILGELREIKELLKLQAAGSRTQLKEELKVILSTPERKKMYAMFNGRNTPKVIAESLNTHVETVRVLIKELERCGLVKITKKGNEKVPQKVI